MDMEQRENRVTDDASGQPKKRPRRPAGQADATGTGAPRKRPASADGERPAGMKKRPAPADGERPAGMKKRPAPADGERPAGMKKRPAPADGERPAGMKKRPASAEGERPAGMKKRPASAEGERPAGMKKRPASAEGERPAGMKKRPASADSEQPAGMRKRPASADSEQPAGMRKRPVSAEGERLRRPAQDRTRAAAPTRSRAAQPVIDDAPETAAAPKKRKLSAWRIGMLIYIGIFLIITGIAMRWIWVLCREYEDSQPKHIIENYVEDLNKKSAEEKKTYYDDLVTQKIKDLPLSQYETVESINATLNIEEPTEINFTFIKSKRYTEDKPVYYLRNGESVIAEVELVSKEKTPKHEFNLWTLDKVSSVVEVSSEPEYEVSVVMPEGSTLKINDIPVDAGIMTAAESPLELDEVALQNTQKPTAKACVITGLYAEPKVAATDAAGNPLTLKDEVKPGTKKASYVFEPAEVATPDEAIIARTKDMTAVYINYLINEGYAEKGDKATWQNLAALDPYLLKNSKLYTILHKSVGELNWNNAYTSRKDEPLEVAHQKVYTDNLCTIEVKYGYQLTKTRDGRTTVNNYSGSIRWTMVKVGDKWYASDYYLIQSSEGGTNSTVSG